ncbi:MAG: AmmeMemoRadiSam system protein B, partial [Nitrospinae bacterium]|nr:AmmeMemoRadiSam system protein B [Nitrospinota bacterium]
MILSEQKNHEKRQPAVAGRFYPAEREALVREVEAHIDRNVKKSRALGIVAPHAGFMYSGDVAGGGGGGEKKTRTGIFRRATYPGAGRGGGRVEGRGRAHVSGVGTPPPGESQSTHLRRTA